MRECWREFQDGHGNFRDISDMFTLKSLSDKICGTVRNRVNDAVNGDRDDDNVIRRCYTM